MKKLIITLGQDLSAYATIEVPAETDLSDESLAAIARKAVEDAFGGSADDRPLGIDGLILERGSNAPRAEFETIEQAHEATKAIKNRRPNSILGVLPSWR